MKKYFLICLLVFISLTFSGCGFTVGNLTLGTEEVIQEKKEAINADEVTVLPALEDDAYYVLHNDDYIPIYFGNSSFDEGEVVQEPQTTRLLWYIDDGTKNSDINSIPTLFRDDKLVYRYSDTLTEEFNFERFMDLGRSFGIYGLAETKSGRYSLSIDPELMYPDSDVFNDISTLTSETVIIEQIETTKLRAGLGLVSDYGTISNFNIDEQGNIIDANPNDEYRFLVYNGTFKNTFTFKPTYRILGSYEDYISYDYTFIDDDLIEITIPAWFQSGYYLINGVGVVRYINGESKDYDKASLKEVDLNIPTVIEGLEGNFNALSEGSAVNDATNGASIDLYGDHSTDLLDSLTINEDGNWQLAVTTPGSYNITIALEITPIEGLDRNEPACTLTTSAGEAFHFSYDDEASILKLSNVYLPTGKAYFEFNDLTGITPTFQIEKGE